MPLRIDRIRVKNFRNLADVDLPLPHRAVVVGENRTGKSNLVHALRLVLDPTMSGSDRHLTREDFWDGLSDGSENWDPIAAQESIEISLDIVDFDDDLASLTSLGDALVEQEPMRARLTYRFSPVDTGAAAHPEGAQGPVKYRGTVYGADNETPLAGDLRGYLYLVFLHALRDVEADLNSWRRSPLRGLLQAAADAVGEEDLAQLRGAVKAANDKVNQLGEIKAVGADISKRITEIVGANQRLDTELAVAPEDPLRLIRSMRLFVDGTARRHLSTTSLGTLNVLYYALLELGLDQKLSASDITHVVMAIEEPEAHLHPHMQRLVFGRLLTDREPDRSVLVTTQSPHIASVADPRSLVVLRDVGGQSRACAAHTAELAEAEWDDLARYLDATRAEMVFARRVLLVEGYAEQVMIPRMAEVAGHDLDKLGITVCAVHGTHFDTYARFCAALGIPWAIITDGDDGAGLARAERIVNRLGHVGDPADHGVFVGDSTFEYDVMNVSTINYERCTTALRELVSTRSAAIIDGWSTPAPLRDTYLKMIKTAGGKGRFAHRLTQTDVSAPDYVLRALEYLAR